MRIAVPASDCSSLEGHHIAATAAQKCHGQSDGQMKCGGTAAGRGRRPAACLLVLQNTPTEGACLRRFIMRYGFAWLLGVPPLLSACGSS